MTDPFSHSTTTVTDPAGGVTTVLYDSSRNISGVVNPLGQQSKYRYSRELLQSAENAEGGRTTYSYKTLSQNVRRLEVEEKPAGRTTYIYDTSSGKLQTTVNPLSGRTTYVRDTNGRLLAKVNDALRCRRPCHRANRAERLADDHRL